MKLIHTKDYLLLIDEEAEINGTGTLIYENDTNLINITGVDYEPQGLDSKIIAYYPLTKEAKELDLPLLPNPFEEEADIDKIANEWFLINNYNKEDLIHSHSIPNCITTKNLFIEGYKAAQSNKLFSLEDIKKAIEMAREADSIDDIVDLHIVLNYPNADNSDLRIKWTEEEIIQSLVTQKLPKEFVGWLSKKKCPYDFTSKCTIDSCDCEFVFETITNSEGKQVLVGTYKY